MKIILLFVFLFVILLSCDLSNSQTKKLEKNLPQASTANSAIKPSNTQKSAPMENVDFLEKRTISINNKFPLITTVNNIERILGKADSVNQIDFDEMCSSDFRSENSKIAYYGGVSFEQFGDSLDFIGIDFSQEEKAFLQIGKLRIDQSTTPELIIAHFPKLMLEYGKDESDQISIPPSKELSDGYWLLLFKKGKIISFDDWFPC